MMGPTIEVTAQGYTAYVDLDSRSVDISRGDICVGRGRWSGTRIEDCAANLGDAAYDALDAAIVAACAEASE